MTSRQIKLNAVEDVQALVNAAERCSYDVDIFYNRVIIDARSFLGILSMDLRNIMTIKYSVEDRSILEPVLNRLAA